MSRLVIDDTGCYLAADNAKDGDCWLAGASRGYRPYWTTQPYDMRLWTCWERVGGEIEEVWPAVMDDFGTLRPGKAVRRLAHVDGVI